MPYLLQFLTQKHSQIIGNRKSIICVFLTNEQIHHSINRIGLEVLIFKL